MNNVNLNRVSLLLIGVLFSLVMSTVYSKTWNYSQYTKINWRQYNAAAFLEAKEKNKPLYVFVYSDECSWCKKFEMQTLETKTIQEILEKVFIPVAINQVNQPELAKKLGVKLVPGNILLTPDKKNYYVFMDL